MDSFASTWSRNRWLPVAGVVILLVVLGLGVALRSTAGTTGSVSSDSDAVAGHGGALAFADPVDVDQEASSEGLGSSGMGREAVDRTTFPNAIVEPTGESSNAAATAH